MVDVTPIKGDKLNQGVITKALNQSFQIVQKATQAQWNDTEIERLKDAFGKFYDDYSSGYYGEFIDYIEYDYLDDAYAGLKLKYGAGIQDFTGLDKYDKDRLYDLFGFDVSDEAIEDFQDFMAAEYNINQNARILSFFKIASANFDLKNPELLAEVFERQQWWDGHTAKVMQKQASNLVGDLLYEGVTGYNAISDYDEFPDYLKYRGKNVIIKNKQALNNLLKDYSAKQKKVFVDTEANAMLNMTGRHHLERNNKIYKSAKWQHKYGKYGKPLGDDQLRPNHQAMHGIKRNLDGLFDSFISASGQNVAINGPYDSKLGADDTVLCHCWLAGVFGSKSPNKKNINTGDKPELAPIENLSQDEKDVIRSYTTIKRDYERWNNYLRGQTSKITPGDRKDIKILQDALDKTEKLKGKAWRGVTFKKRSDYYKYLGSYYDADTITLKGFTSATFDKDAIDSIIFRGHPLRVKIHIQGKTGVNVSSLSVVPESEVLFNHNTAFKIKKIDDSQVDTNWDWVEIFLEEI